MTKNNRLDVYILVAMALYRRGLPDHENASPILLGA